MSELPLTLVMEIELSAAAHKRDVADGFAKLREQLLPPIQESQEAALQRMLMNMHPAQQMRMHADMLGASAQGLYWAGIQGNSAPSTFTNCWASTSAWFGPYRPWF
jgi:hypothetical protein